MKIKKLNEMMDDVYDYSNIINIMKKRYHWGFGVMNFFEDFESNPEYFQSPKGDDNYADEFNIFLKDLQTGNMRGGFQNRQSLRPGEWNTGIKVNRPESIYNKFY
jgi:hypothetical protein